MRKIDNMFDAIVVGSGITGGWAAKELSEKGLKVLVLDRGKSIVHGADYLGEHAPDWKLPYQGIQPRDLYSKEYPVQSTNYAFSEATRHFYVNDKDQPYETNGNDQFNWIRSDVLGGRSLLWGRQSYRWSEQDFNANSKDGHGIPWPIGYDDLSPWYSYVEKFIGVSGESLGLKELPDSEFLPAMGTHKIEQTIKSRLAKKAPYAKMTIGRAAILTKNHNGRSACHYCGPCHRGCSTGSYFSSLSSTLPAAKATGNLTIRANSIVERLIYDENTKRVSEVHVIDSITGEHLSFSSRLIFLCSSTVGSTQIMLNSRSDSFPNGLGNTSGALGRYLMDHPMGVVGLGVFFDDMNSYWHGNRPNGSYIPRFRNLDPQKEELGFVRGYGYQTSVLRTNWKTNIREQGFGKTLKDKLRKPGPWIWALTAFAECLPDKRNGIALHETKRDKHGIPLVEFSSKWRSNEKSLMKDAAQQCQKLLRAAGSVHSIINPDINVPMGSGIHEMGTARMGNSPENSVLNKYNQSHDVKNLFVTDGACMTSSSCVNPSLTYMALTARACDYAVSQLQAGKI